MSDLDNLRPEVQAAIRTMSGEAGGNRDDAYDVIEAELLRLARENDEWQTRCLQFQTERDKAWAELAALKKERALHDDASRYGVHAGVRNR